MAISIDLAIGSVATSGGGGGGSVNTGVLQVSGGGALSGTLQTITDQSSNASPLQLSTGSVRVAYPTGTYNGAFSLTGGDSTGAAGVSFLDFIPSTNATSYYHAIGFAYDNSNWLGFYRGSRITPAFAFGNNLIWTPNYNLSVGHTAASARLHVKGDGTNPIATFENGAGASQFNIQQSGQINFASQIQGPLLRASTNLAASAFQTQNYAGIWLIVDDSANVGSTSFTPSSTVYSSGTNTRRQLSLSYTINTTGGTNTVTGIFLNATETSLTGTTHNLMDLQGGDTGGLSVFRVSKNRVSSARFETIVRLGGGSDTAQHYIYGGEGNSTGIVLNRANGAVGLFGSTGVLIGDSTFAASGGASARLHVRGDGTNSVQRWENGAGTLLGRWLNNGNLIIGDDSTNNFGTINIDGSGNLIINPNSGLGKTFRVVTGVQNTFQISGGWDGGGGFLFTGGTNNSTSSNLNLYGFTGGNINVTSAGTGSSRIFNIGYTINNTAAQTGTATGIFLNATETALNGMTHNLMDLQVGGASRFLVSRTGVLNIGNNLEMAGSQIIMASQNRIVSNSSGVMMLINNAFSDFNRLQFGGTTNAEPAIKKNGAAIDFRLADDSSYANINTGQIFGYTAGGSPIVRFKLGEISGGQGISTREGQFAIGFTDANQNAGIRILSTGSGVSYIDGWNEGTTKALNYRVVFGSRVSNTGANITDSTTAENGTPFVFGFDVHDASAIVQINSTTRGFLPPRMTTTQINAIATPAEGLVVFNTTISHLCVYQGGAWVRMSHSPM